MDPFSACGGSGVECALGNLVKWRTEKRMAPTDTEPRETTFTRDASHATPLYKTLDTVSSSRPSTHRLSYVHEKMLDTTSVKLHSWLVELLGDHLHYQLQGTYKTFVLSTQTLQ